MKVCDTDDFTTLLMLAQGGDEDAENRFFELVDGELRAIAARLTRGHVGVRATSLVNEAYLYLFRRVKVKKDLDLKNRSYFFTAIANRMRNILLDRLKKRRPGPWDPMLDEVLEDFRTTTNWEFEVVHEALEKFLRSSDPRRRRRHELISLHFFAGMTYHAAAAELGISLTQCHIDRARALAELQLEINAALE